ncbi:MAG: metallophosphoesterase, partial [Sinomicrobium sp.]|nr:metallophosphoesterase [Sinomicrobium sp.]
MAVRWIIFLLLYFLIDWYAFQAVRTITKNRWVHYVHIAVSVLVVGNFMFRILAPDDAGRVLTPARSYAFGLLLTLMILKIMVLPFMFGEDIVRLGAGLYNKLFGAREAFFVPSRRKFVSQVALGVAAIPFVSLLYGMYKGKYDFL